MHDHNNPYCNCEDCWWSRDQQEICPVCGCVGDNCPEIKKESEDAKDARCEPPVISR